ncbi:ATP synthase complex subunit h family protein [Clavispora lusitaniae]|uniref:ATP synthase complex subunit h family protein n=1 Tax=Clavispora lusitaniae TaxID=36911 RepID=UPI0016988120|nr:ATP synthase F0 subcomplex subunit H atp14 [Clavispora lusitaniae]KAF7583534.1 ATP synthase complex subunit h family protein [Clavispora lusitaniae]
MIHNPRALSSRRLFSVTPKRNNLVADLYVQQIKQFKPTPVAADQAEGIKTFKLPSKPAIPSDEVSADAVSSYEAADVETESAPVSGSAPVEEDWFVFEEEEEHH